MPWRFRTAVELKEALGENWHPIAQELLSHWSGYISQIPIINEKCKNWSDIDRLLGITPEPELQFHIEQRLFSGGSMLAAEYGKIVQESSLFTINVLPAPMGRIQV